MTSQADFTTDRVSIGPSNVYAVAGTLRSWPIWLGIVTFIVSSLPAFCDIRQWPGWVVDGLLELNHAHVGLWSIAYMSVLFIAGLVRSATTRYEMTDDCIVVTHGFFTAGSRGGLFRTDVNSIAMNLIIDVNYQQNVFDVLLRVGTVEIRTVEGEIILMPFCENPSDVRTRLMAKSGVGRVKAFAKMSDPLP